MAGSAFNLSSGIGSDGKSTRATKVQLAHGFSAGSVVRYVQNATGNTGDFQLALANSAVNAEVVGIVESVTANEFVIVYGGEINVANFGSDVGGPLTISDVWFLDPTVTGGMTAYAPVTAGNLVKPVLTLVSGANDDIGLVTNFVGTVVGGENTVSLTSVNPVGEIIPWGGETYNIPTGWQLCDGGTVSTATYPEYYTTVGTKFGYEVELEIAHQGDTGTVATGQIMDVGATAAQTLAGPTVVKSSVVSYTETSSGGGGTAVCIVDPDIFVGIQGVGGETSGDDAFFPHGLVYDASALSVGSTAYTVNNRTISSAKTPDMRSRTTIGAGDAHGTYDGFTAGQVGGAEDADTIVVTSDGSQRVYKANSTSSANLRDPFVATHYIARISSHAPAAILGDVTFNNADDDLTDHSTAIKVDGDVLVWDGDASNYKNLKLFNSYPNSIGNFEGNFIIDTTNARIGIGDDSPETDIHIKRVGSPTILVHDTSNNCKLYLQSNDTYAYVGTFSGHEMRLATGNSTRILIAANGTITNNYLTNFGAGVNVTGNVDATGNIVASGGQIRSNSVTLVGNTTPNMNNGNVHIVDMNGGTAFTLKNPSGEVAGAMYSFVFDNVGNGNNVTLSIGTQYKFANGIKPNIVRAGKILVISAVCLASSWLLCTWAEDFS